jgi:cysteine-rich repeat protein
VEGAAREECDDANAANDDDCTRACRRARCGDGFVRTGIESCDDGDRNYWDSCLGNCEPARCGDGYLNVENEQCDDGNTEPGDACSQSCRWTGFDCADADANGRVTATDASQVLRAGVSSLTACPMERCDVDRNGLVTAHDALLVLRVAIGLSTPEACARLVHVTFRLADTQRLGALQIALDYRQVAGEFLGDGEHVACESLLGGLASYNDYADERILRVGVISTTGIQGPGDVVRCNFADTGGPLDLAFAWTIEDAASPDLEPIDPSIELRVEPAP